MEITNSSIHVVHRSLYHAVWYPSEPTYKHTAMCKLFKSVPSTVNMAGADYLLLFFYEFLCPSILWLIFLGNWGSPVTIVTSIRAGRSWFDSCHGQGFFLSPQRQTGSAVHLASHPVGTGALGAVLWLRPLVAGLSLCSSGFAPWSIHMGFVVGKVALGQVSPLVLRVFPVSIIPPSFSILIYHLGDEQYVR
jgi:hypothetical protein